MAVADLIPHGLGGVCWLSRGAMPRHPRRNVPHRHPEIEANLIETGTCRYLIDDQVQSMSRGDLFWLFPEQQHMIIDASADMSLWVVIARPAFLATRVPRLPVRPAERQPGAAHEGYARPHRLREGDRLHLAGVAAALGACQDDARHHDDGLAWLFAQACRLTERQAGRAGRPLHPAIAKALSLLEADPSMPLPDLASTVHLSASRLSHLFAEQVERSVSAHRNHLKLRRFQQQVADGHCRNLTQAAFDAGFGSYAQFARVLRASTGVAPRELLADRKPQAAVRQPQTSRAQRGTQSAPRGRP